MPLTPDWLENVGTGVKPFLILKLKSELFLLFLLEHETVSVLEKWK